jgi:mannose-6-phosphate isomerase-like protein (cupin superfamily)
MQSEFLIDLNDHETAWKGSTKHYRPDGSVASEAGAVISPEGPRHMFWMLDTIMYAMPESTNPDEHHMPHEHRHGYETFFVDSGKLWLYIDGMKCMLIPGDIVHLQATQAHGMAFIEDVKWRGTYHDYIVSDDVRNVRKVMEHMPETRDDPELQKLDPGMDFVPRERFLFKEVPVEECPAIRNPKRPLAEYKFEGVTMKVLIQRWENGGAKELCCAEMEPGFTAEWVKYPKIRELLYVRNGEVKFKVMNDEFVAYSECLVNIPKFAPHSLEALTKAEVYDMGGLTMWSSFLHDYMSIKTYDPERFAKPEVIGELKEKFNCQIKCIGMKK